MNKSKIILLFISILILLVGCSSEKRNSEAALIEQMNEEIREYDSHLQSVFTTANNLLSIFNTSVDGLYTGSTSSSQFAKILTDNIINESRELVSMVDKYDVHTNFFEIDQLVLSHINKQHQLFLDAVDMANEDKIKKSELRKRYVELKEEQAAIINKWKEF